MLVSYAKAFLHKCGTRNAEASRVPHEVKEGCKATSECSDNQRSEGNGFGSPGEPLGACEYRLA